MISDQKQDKHKTNFDIEKNITTENLYDLVEKSLISFYYHIKEELKEIKVIKNSIIPEKFFNQQLSECIQIQMHDDEKYLGVLTVHEENSDEKDLIRGKSEGKKGLSKQVDIALKNSKKRKTAFLIECKRLYNKNDKQYVSGKNGGIRRFKAKEHGAGFNNACIVGYVQEHDFVFWRSKINNWLLNQYENENDLIFAVRENIQPFIEKNDKTSKCISLHERIGSEPIELTHLWVYIHP